MNRKIAEKRLAQLGFEIDWDCTQKVDGYWSGTMDAIGRGMIDGDCRGEAINSGSTQAEFLRDCITAAEGYAKHGPNAQCTDPECDFHDGHPIGGQ
jgi:hypothetical protein